MKTMFEDRFEVWEGDILRASQDSEKMAQKYMKEGRIIKKNRVLVF